MIKKILYVLSLLCLWNGVFAMANPASVYCGEKWGKLEILKDSTWAEYWMCTLTDGTKCEEWSYYRWECPAKVITWEDVKMCTMDYNPVCWVDGKTYWNKCSAGNVWVAYEWECKTESLSGNTVRMCTREYNPVCWVDGKTYWNKCTAGDTSLLYEWECVSGNTKMTNVIKKYLDKKFVLWGTLLRKIDIYTSITNLLDNLVVSGEFKWSKLDALKVIASEFKSIWNYIVFQSFKTQAESYIKDNFASIAPNVELSWAKLDITNFSRNNVQFATWNQLAAWLYLSYNYGKTAYQTNFEVKFIDGKFVIYSFNNLWEEFVLRKSLSNKTIDWDFIVEITSFVNSPCPVGAQCFWSWLWVNMKYTYKGETKEWMNLFEAFWFKISLVDSDYTNYAKFKVEK